MKKGITGISITIMVVIMLILLGTISITGYNSIQNANKLVFALEISNIQEETTKYLNNFAEDSILVKNNIYTLNLSGVSEKELEQFSSENIVDDSIELYELDLSVLEINDTKFGRGKTEKDIYVFSKESGRVYYLEGVKYKDRTYYTLTQELIDIKERNEIATEQENSNDEAPVITTGDFAININSSGEDDIYLTNIKVTGKNITKIKYENAKIEEKEAANYFKYHGYDLLNDRLKLQKGEYITIYAETSSGKFSIKQAIYE